MLDTASDFMLRTADKIVLVDAKHPGWSQPLFVRLKPRSRVTVELPVDWTDRRTIQEWLDHVIALHLDG